jgi:hypothetical protein
MLELLHLFVDAIRRWLRNRRRLAFEASARTWPKAQGRVHSSTQKRAVESNDGWRNWQTELTYSYFVEGEYYSGSSLLPPESEDEADEERKRWEDRSVTVRYWPNDRTQSILLLEDQQP